MYKELQENMRMFYQIKNINKLFKKQILKLKNITLKNH